MLYILCHLTKQKYFCIKEPFIPKQPYASWTLNEDTCNWNCPVDYPTEIEDADGNPIFYNWNEENQEWITS